MKLAKMLTMVLAGGACLFAQPNHEELTQAMSRLERRTVTGAPYSATMVSTSSQTLADGTHITHTAEAQIARDSQGRTRREQGTDTLGPWKATGASEHIVFISDPVAQVRYTLRPDRQSAIKMNLSTQMLRADVEKMSREIKATVAKLQAASAKEAASTKEAASPKEAANAQEAAARAGKVEIKGETVTLASFDGRNFTVILGDGEHNKAKVEDLGEKILEGVKVKGRRESRTIAIGEIGNDRPIEVSSEVWTSDELQTVVYSKRSDPRVGETEYRLTNISRADPSLTLFEVPPGYTIQEEGRKPGQRE